MKIDILTIFPEMFTPLQASITGRAMHKGIFELAITDVRLFSRSKHHNTDDYPFGGGAGMLMMPQPVADAIKQLSPDPYPGKRIYVSPRGIPFTQKIAVDLSRESNLLILCGRYEGLDERVINQYIDMELSIGDYVLTGGELAAMVIVDCITRLIPGTLGSESSAEDESFSSNGLLEYPQYTRPRVFEGIGVPDVLLNGDHQKIQEWRRRQSLLITMERRPDLIEKADLSLKEREWLKALKEASLRPENRDCQ